MTTTDTIREALNELQGLIHHIERTTGHEYDSRKLHAAFKALSTIDPEAIRRECAGELQLLDKQRKEVHALVHKRPAPAGIVSMLCNMTERHTIELAKLYRSAIMGKD